MISSTEQTQIRDYLIYKKLPIDILLEVQDHFENQIESLERENNISFQEAFLLAKMSWEKDFKLVRKSLFSFSRVPRIVKETQKEVTSKLIIKSSIITFALLFFQLITARFMAHEYYLLINVLIYLMAGLLILEMTLVYIFSKIDKKRTRAEQYFNNQLLQIFIFYIILGIFGAFTKFPTNSFKVIYDFVNGVYQFSADYFFAAVVSMLFTRGVTFYLFFMLNDRAKSIKKIKKFQIA